MAWQGEKSTRALEGIFSSIRRECTGCEGEWAYHASDGRGFFIQGWHEDSKAVQVCIPAHGIHVRRVSAVEVKGIPGISWDSSPVAQESD